MDRLFIVKLAVTRSTHKALDIEKLGDKTEIKAEK